jgi:cytochrome oxidase Cu insertion factor (SCO1/SenC/PrrC family)
MRWTEALVWVVAGVCCLLIPLVLAGGLSLAVIASLAFNAWPLAALALVGLALLFMRRFLQARRGFACFKMILPILLMLSLLLLGCVASQPPAATPTPAPTLAPSPGGLAQATPAPTRFGVKAGEVAPDFRLTNVDGREFTLGQLGTKPVVVLFAATWCTPCLALARSIRGTDEATGGDRFHAVFVSLDPGDSDEALREFARNYGGSDWYYARDANNMAQTYEVRFLETLLVIDKSGVITYRQDFRQSYEKIEAAIRKTLVEA